MTHHTLIQHHMMSLLICALQHSEDAADGDGAATTKRPLSWRASASSPTAETRKSMAGDAARLSPGAGRQSTASPLQAAILKRVDSPGAAHKDDATHSN